MKHTLALFFLAVLLLPQISFANCEEKSASYVIRGNMKAKYPGARLWRLPDLKKDAAANKECAKEIFDRAFAESDEYWNHIDQKYNCNVFSDQKEKSSSTCSDSLSDKILSNKAYLSFMKLESAVADDNCVLRGHSRKNGALSGTARKNLRETAAVLGTLTAPKDKCTDVPLKDKISSSPDSSSDIFEEVANSLGSCISGLFRGITTESIVPMVKSIWDLVSDPWGTVEALREISKALVKDHKATLKIIANRMIESFRSLYLAKYDKYDCYSPQKQSEVICSSIGQGAVAVVGALLGTQVFKAGMEMMGISKASKSAVKLNTILSDGVPKLPGPRAQKLLTGPSTTMDASSASSQKLLGSGDSAKLADDAAKKPFTEKPKTDRGTSDSKKETGNSEAKRKADSKNAEQEKIDRENAESKLKEDKKLYDQYAENAFKLKKTDDIATIKSKLDLKPGVDPKKFMKSMRGRFSDRNKDPRAEELMKHLNGVYDCVFENNCN